MHHVMTLTAATNLFCWWYLPAHRLSATPACPCQCPQIVGEHTNTHTGIADADIVLHVRDADPNDPDSCTATTFASAGGCDYDPTTLRPTVGEVPICPNLFSQTEGEARLHSTTRSCMLWYAMLLQATATALQGTSHTHMCLHNLCNGSAPCLMPAAAKAAHIYTHPTYT